MRNPRRVVNIALIVVAVIVVGAAVIAATTGGRSSQSGNAQACSAFWSWDDSTAGTVTAPVLSAYQKATTEPLIADLYNVSLGLKDQGKGLNGDKATNAALAQQFAAKAETDCTTAGYPDPAT
jgi:hypothetical protein